MTMQVYVFIHRNADLEAQTVDFVFFLATESVEQHNIRFWDVGLEGMILGQEHLRIRQNQFLFFHLDKALAQSAKARCVHQVDNVFIFDRLVEKFRHPKRSLSILRFAATRL